MESKELRIGNWVSFRFSDGSNPVQIHWKDFREMESEIKVEFYTPIPLTEQWLIDFGFEKWPWCDDCAFTNLFFGDSLYCRFYNEQWHIKRMKIGTDREGYFGKSQGKYILPKGQLKYVHQLQNLYFALTGKELIKTK